MTDIAESETYARRMLEGLLSLPGYIDDVAKRMIALARLYGEDKTVVCRYGRIELHARSTSTIAQIRAYFESECRKYFGRPNLRVV